MKKFLIALLAALACVLTITACDCNNTEGGGNPPAEYTVEFVPTEKLKYSCADLEEGKNTLTVEENTVVSFSVSVPTLYDIPTVYANGSALKAQEGVYSVTVTEDVTITTSEVKLTNAYILGDGTSNSPALISTPADYLFLAERINAGDASFISLYYALANDIDFGGMEIPVIGNGATATSYFMGNFNGNGHTISNFKINANGISYVGLFGYLVSSGNDDGTGMIVNLHIDNFEIVAQASEQGSIFVGSLVGYSIASSVIACSATNGSIVVHADDAALSYVGGAVGIQNSAILTDGNQIYDYPAATSYVYTNVDIDCSGGVYAAGGVVGYVVSEHERAISSVINCYSEGAVFGAIYSGGLVGYLSDYSSVANCYSLSDVFAYSRYDGNEDFSHVYSGGLVGYIGNNAIISDSFAKNGIIDGESKLGASYLHIGDLVGGNAEATAVAGKGILFNCKSGNDVTTTVSFFKNTLYWRDCDWVIKEGSYPVINMTEAEENNFTITFNYSGKKVDNKQNGSLSISLSENFYSPMFYFYGEEFGDIVIADSGETSYGYFFDQELTQRVPYGFIPTRDITLYTGFMDYSAVAGKYYLVSRNSNREITITLNKDSSYTYNDGVEFNDFYTYDGNKIIFNNALFGRLSSHIEKNYDNSGASIDRPDLNYNFAKFAAVKAEFGLKIYDGTYFTEEDYLTANRYAISGEWYKDTDRYVFYTDLTGKLNNQSFTYTLSSAGVLTIKIGNSNTELNLSSLSKFDSFKGVWEIASNINRKYEFDGINGWTYMVKGVKKGEGTYTIDEHGVANLTGDFNAEAQLDPSGYLLIKKGDTEEYFVKTGSFSGIWIDLENNVIIYIDGFGNSLAGSALISEGGVTNELTYIIDGFFDGDGKQHLTLLKGYTLFGYLTYNDDYSLVGTFFSSNTLEYLGGYNFYLLDTLEGDWVGEGSLGGTNIDSIHFNGLGIYGNGSVSLNNGDGIDYTLDENFDASFGDYTVSFDDENNVITIKLGDETAEFYRKDEISAYVLVSEDGTKYAFNGGGNLSKGGKLTVTDAEGNQKELGYKNIEGSIAGLDLTVELYGTYRNTSTSVGNITIKNYKFEVKYTTDTTGLSSETLTIDNPFTGTWCVSQFTTTIVIGELDLSNTASGYFLDMKVEVTYTYYPEYECLMVPYITDEMTTPVALYLIVLSEGNMAISSYEVLTPGDDLKYCAHNDGLFGTWRDSAQNSQKTFNFDGLADSLYTVGIAWNESGEFYFYTRRFGTLYFWSSDGKNAYTIVKWGDDANASMKYYKNAREYIVFNDFDLASSILKINDGGTVYDFNLTNVKVNGVEKEYSITKVDGDITELVIYENKEDTKGVRFKVNHAENTIEELA